MYKKLTFIKINAEVYLLLTGILFIILQNLFQLSADKQMIVLLTLVFLVGVPHGALDFLVEEQNERTQNKIFYLKKFVAVYVTRLAAVALIWIFPFIAFAIFLIFSIFHFGETDMAGILKTKKKAALLYMAYGSFFLAVLFLVHLSEIQDSLPVAKSFFNNSNWFAAIKLQRYYFIAVFSLLLVAVIGYQFYIKNIVISLPQIIKFALLILIVTSLPLLLAFAFYFALWHSILSVRNIVCYFKRNNNTAKFMFFCKKSILFSLLALAGIVILYFILNYFLPDVNLMFALLVILSVLTLPHLQVMHRMYQNNLRSADR